MAPSSATAKTPNTTSSGAPEKVISGTKFPSRRPTQALRRVPVRPRFQQNSPDLRPTTTYHYRLVASNSVGATVSSNEESFNTPPAPPLVNNESASDVHSESAKLSANINPGGAATTYHFEYGTASCASNPCTSTPNGELIAGLKLCRRQRTAQRPHAGHHLSLPDRRHKLIGNHRRPRSDLHHLPIPRLVQR